MLCYVMLCCYVMPKDAVRKRLFCLNVSTLFIHESLIGPLVLKGEVISLFLNDGIILINTVFLNSSLRAIKVKQQYTVLFLKVNADS